jgi:surface polysaccharide O-acyltransferase-like enzyme
MPALKSGKNRKLYLEVLRIVAIILVLFHHSDWRGFALFLHRDGITSVVYLMLSTLCEVAVPIFFMISGGLLLKKDESIKDILVKRVLKFIIVLFVITVIYHFYDVMYHNRALGSFRTVFHAFMTNGASGALWYMYSYIALLLLLPFLRNIVRNITANQFIYLIVLNLIFVGLLPILSFALSNGKYYYINTFNVVLANTLSFFYFLVGHFFENVVDEKFYNLKNCIRLSVGALAAIVVCTLLTKRRLQLGLGFADSTTEGFQYSLVAVPTYAIYAWAKYIFKNFKEPNRFTAIVSHIGQCTFGIFLLERILRERTVFIFDWFDGFLPCVIACFLWIFVIILIGTAVVSVIKLIPGVKKYI